MRNHGDGADLAEAAAIMWRHIEELTSALAEAPAEATYTMQADGITLRHRLVSLLERGDLDEEALQIARALNLDPSGTFTVALVDGRITVDRLAPAARPVRPEERVVVTALGDTAVAIIQARTPASVITRLREQAGEAIRLSMGLERRGLVGCAASLQDARKIQASCAQAEGVYQYSDHWLRASLMAEAGSLRPLVERGIEVAQSHHHLAETVLAYIDNDMNAATTALALNLHANSASYRLARWQELTGLEVRSLSGLTASALACWLADSVQGRWVESSADDVTPRTTGSSK